MKQHYGHAKVSWRVSICCQWRIANKSVNINAKLPCCREHFLSLIVVSGPRPRITGCRWGSGMGLWVPSELTRQQSGMLTCSRRYLINLTKLLSLLRMLSHACFGSIRRRLFTSQDHVFSSRVRKFWKWEVTEVVLENVSSDNNRLCGDF